jgi:hypothetical protein
MFHFYEAHSSKPTEQERAKLTNNNIGIVYFFALKLKCYKSKLAVKIILIFLN